MARDLRTPKYKLRVVPLKRNKPLRKVKHKRKFKDEDNS